MEHFDISKGGSPLYLPIDDNINQWASLYNTRMHYRMLADRERQERNRLKADAMVKEIDKVLSFSPNNIFDGSEDNKLITDAISPYRNSIIDIKSRLLGGDLSALSDGANLLAQFTKVLDPNGNPIKSFSKQNYVLNQIQNNIKELLDPKSFTLDASRQYKAITNDLINKYNTGQIRLDQLVQGVQNIDKRGFRTLDHFIDLAKNIPLDELQSLSSDNMWKYDSKNPNKNKVAGVLLGAVNYVGGKDMDLFNFYKVTKNKKGEEVREAISEEEYKKIVEANSKVSDKKLKVNVDALMKRDIRECTTLACRRVLGEVYPVIKGTSQTRIETKLHESKLKQDEYVHQKNVDKDYKTWEEQLNATTATYKALAEALKNKDLSPEERNSLLRQFAIEISRVQQLFRGKTAIQTEAIPVTNMFSKKHYENLVNNNATTSNPIIRSIAEHQRKKGTLLVNINDEKATAEAIVNHIIKYDPDYFKELNAKGKAKKAIALVVSEGIKKAKEDKIKGNNGYINYTELLKLGSDAKVRDMIGDEKPNDKLMNNPFVKTALASEGSYEMPSFLKRYAKNNIGSRIEQRNKNSLDESYERAKGVPSLKGAETVSFTTLFNAGSIATVMNRMNSHASSFLSTSTLEKDNPITLQDKTVEGIIGYGVSKLGYPLFKLQYKDKDGNVKTDIFMYANNQKENLIDNINIAERTNDITIPKVTTKIDYQNPAGYTAEQNNVISEFNSIKGYIKDFNKVKPNDSNNNEDTDSNKDDSNKHDSNNYYSYDIRYGNNTIKISILKDDHGNLTNKYIASTVINGKKIGVKLSTDMTIKQRNKIIYDNLLTFNGLKRLLQKEKNNGRRKPR